LLKYEEMGVDQVVFIQQAGRNRHEHICESLQRFATDVMPEFKVRDQVYEQQKRERLAPAIEAAEALVPPIITPKELSAVDAYPVMKQKAEQQEQKPVEPSEEGESFLISIEGGRKLNT
jgi:hypothetical protein